MALFDSSKPGGMAPIGRSESEAGRGLSIIGPGMKVNGDVETDGVVKIEGQVVGTIRAGRQVLIAKGGEVEGDILAPEVILGGEVRGSILAEQRVEVQVASVIHGDITTKRLLVAEGGQVNGVIRMEELPSVSRAGQPSGGRALAAT